MQLLAGAESRDREQPTDRRSRTKKLELRAACPTKYREGRRRGGRPRVSGQGVARELRRAGAQGRVAFSPDQAVYAATELGGWNWAVKAQIHAGARGKAGGIKMCRTYHEVRDAAKACSASGWSPIQTGPRGQARAARLCRGGRAVRRASSISASCSTAKSSASASSPRSAAAWRSRRSRATSPRPSSRWWSSRRSACRPFQARELAFQLGLNIKQAQSAVSTIMNAYRAFRDCDATMLEINPLVVTKDDRVRRARRQDVVRRQRAVPPPQHRRHARSLAAGSARGQAAEHNLNYIGLDGEIGCIVNGAGLAMATMDMIKHAGGEPANFLDVGGGASPERIATAFKLVLSDRQGEGRARQHLRRHQPLRLGRQGRGAGVRDGRRQGAAGRAAGRHQRRGGPEDRGARAGSSSSPRRPLAEAAEKAVAACEGSPQLAA